MYFGTTDREILMEEYLWLSAMMFCFSYGHCYTSISFAY